MALFHCDSCGLSKEVPDKYVGRTVKCPKCKSEVVIRAEEPEPESGEQDLKAPDAMAGGEDAPDIPPPDVGPGANLDDPDFAQGVEDFDDEDDEGVRVPSGPAIPIATDEEAPARVGLFYGNPLNNVYAGLITALVTFFFCLAYAVLVFGNTTSADQFPHGVSILLVTAVVAGLIYSLRSTIPFAMGGPETVSVAVTSLMAVNVHASMVGQYEQGLIFPTVTAAVVAGAAVTGILLYVVGTAGWGKWIRFIPHQVVGGILAGVGLLILKQAYAFQTGHTLCLEEWTRLLGYENCLRWAPGFALGIVLFLIHRRFRHYLVLPVLILVAAGGALAGLHFTGTPVQGLAQAGWTFEGWGIDPFWQIYFRSFFERIQWSVVAAQAPYILALAAVLLATFMLKVTDVETDARANIDMDLELIGLGQANILTALAGGMAGNLSRNRSLTKLKIGQVGPLAGVVSALLLGAALVYVGYAVPYVPKFVPAGLLVYMGLNLLAHWLMDTWSMFTRKDDYAILFLIFLITVFMGFLVGVGVGLALAMMILVSRYGKVNVVKFTLSGATNRSNVDRAASQLAVLREKGGQIYIMRLQGFIFLGTTATLTQQIRERLLDTEQPPLNYLILDFRLVNGLDSAVAIGFQKLKTLAKENGVKLIFTSIPFEVEQMLEEGGFSLNEPDGSSRTFVDSDFALEWCENRILEENDALQAKERSLSELLKPIFPEPKYIPALMQFLEKVKVKKGKYVFRQGDASDAMYFIESGMVNVQLELEGNKILRLKKMGPGTVFGEMGIYTDAPRSASIVAAEDCVLYRLSAKMLDIMQKKDPHLVSGVHRFIVNLLSGRVFEANTKVRDLLK